VNRRDCLKFVAAAFPAATLPAAAAPPIMLHCDLVLDPAKEKEMLSIYRNTFSPVIKKQPGFVSVALLKLRKENQGKAPAGCPYRLVISFQTEEQRVTWANSEAHKKAFGPLEACLKGEKFNALLYDPIV
jgi:heme-degrading monooxygenase HmoA